MILYLSIFVLSFFIINFIYAVGYLKRIAEALEDFVYDGEEDAEESEVSNGGEV